VVGSREHEFSDEKVARDFYDSLSDLKITKIYLLNRQTIQEILEENEIVRA
jgi:hypothetical protein